MKLGGLPIAVLAFSFTCGCGGAAHNPNQTADASLDASAVSFLDADLQALDAASTADIPADLQRDVHQPWPDAYARPTYTTLSETGLYADPATRTLSPDIQEFRPTYVLWSDGAEKRRFFSLPPGTQIDTSDMDHWVFPVGTRFWKEFSHDGVRLETRLIERYGAGPEDYWFGSFVWTADQTNAVFAVDGQQNINGTQHDAPAQKLCRVCHGGDAGRVLGFSALQLSRKEAGMTLDALVQADLLSNPPSPGTTFAAPGDAVTAAALGYLHANCGHCHNLHGTSWPDTQMVLRLNTSETVAEQTEVWKSLVGHNLQYWRHTGFSQRVVPGDPAQSAVLFRMNARGPEKDQMPPLATEMIDPAGLDLVKRWIEAMPK